MADMIKESLAPFASLDGAAWSSAAADSAEVVLTRAGSPIASLKVGDFRRATTVFESSLVVPAADDAQFLARLAEDTKHDSAHLVVENDLELARCMRLSDEGWIACEQHARGLIPHITRKAIHALRANYGFRS